MVEYTYSEARQRLAALLEQAVQDGEVRIRRKDGRVFVIRPEPGSGSPLDVKSIDMGITTAEIVEFIREGRKTYPAGSSQAESTEDMTRPGR
ncbi:MAG: type II toxin-antitoxin system Phd/YefM family antitoxin [Chloroflexi bacterium]|nr:type II toxin-antitoxin system Phd/YefM family antitoxin [Chloroflexota bacterium]